MSPDEQDAFEAVTGPDGSDARWFAEHPGASEFCRMITDAEVAWLRESGVTEARKSWRVRVGMTSYGRVREFLVPQLRAVPS